MLVLLLVAGLGTVQAALLLLLIGLRYGHRSNFPLALLVLVYSIRLGTIPTWNPAALLAHPWLLPALAPLPFLFGPLLWWSVGEIARRGPASAERDTARRWAHASVLPHFLPYAGGVVLMTLAVTVVAAGDYRNFVAAIFDGRAPLWFALQNLAKVVANLVYVGLTATISFGRSSRALATGRRLWLRALALAPLPSLVFYAYVAVNPAASAALSEGSHLPFSLLAAAMSLLVYALSLLVLLSPEVPRCRQQTSTGTKTALSERECEAIAERVRRELEAGAYRDPELTLSKLAETLAVHPNRLSLAVNHTYRLSFPTLVNRYRIDYFLSRVDDGALANESILDLAFEVGFSSKSTFNRVFKQYTGMPPSGYQPAQAARVRGAAARRR